MGGECDRVATSRSSLDAKIRVPLDMHAPTTFKSSLGKQHGSWDTPLSTYVLRSRQVGMDECRLVFIEMMMTLMDFLLISSHAMLSHTKTVLTNSFLSAPLRNGFHFIQ